MKTCFISDYSEMCLKGKDIFTVANKCLFIGLPWYLAGQTFQAIHDALEILPVLVRTIASHVLSEH